MPLDLDDVIAAAASPPGAAERGIVRVSGINVRPLLEGIFRPDPASSGWDRSRLPTRWTGHADVPQLGTELPVWLMYWPSSRSFTGQPMAEFHLPGSMPLLEVLLERLFQLGARPACRGEFTMRAFLAGRIDLLQAEAVLGVIEASDHEQLQQALKQLGGGITHRLATVRSELIGLLGDLEAGLDFVDEDIQFISPAEIAHRLRACQQLLQELNSDAADRLPADWKYKVVLAGLPNAGKSTLFNCLCGQQMAIVSAIPGTTRDYLTASLTLQTGLGSLDVDLIDTAGWEDAGDLIMQQAQVFRGEQTQQANLIVWCRSSRLNDQQREQDALLHQSLPRQLLLTVLTQSDLLPETTVQPMGVCPSDWLPVSAVTGEGIDPLRRAIGERLAGTQSARGELLSSTAVRCRDSLNRCTTAIECALAAAEQQLGDELTAVELRQALHEISVVCGEVYTDDILDHIFSRFCIGK